MTSVDSQALPGGRKAGSGITHDLGSFAPSCDGEHHCVTCADEGVPMRVVAPEEDGLALCTDGEGQSRTVETTLVGGVAPGDELLVHAGVALVRL